MNKRYIFAAAAILLCAYAGAQGFDEGYFLKDYRMNFRYNPAITGNTDFISAGRFNSNVHNNVGAASFLFPQAGGKLVTGLHPDVSSDVFPGQLPAVSSLFGTLDYNLLSYGIARGNSFHTFELNVRGMYGASMHNQLFKILKLGTADKNYDFSPMSVMGNAYAELAYGYSHRFGDWVSIGGRAKLLLGLASLDYSARQLDVSLTGTEYSLTVDADLDLTSMSTKLLYGETGLFGLPKTSAKEKWGMPTGAGLALDLGVELTPAENLSIALSVLDLGGLFWYYGNAGNSSATLAFNGLYGVTPDQMNLDGLKSMGEEYMKTAIKELKPRGRNNVVRFCAVPMQANLGVKYSMPFYDRLTVGATGRFVAYDLLPYWESRGAIALNPLSWLDVCGSAGYGTYGFVWGAAAAVRVLKFRITAGVENGIGGIIPYTSVPLKANNKTLTLGVTYDL